jgi:hypothetical protein
LLLACQTHEYMHNVRAGVVWVVGCSEHVLSLSLSAIPSSFKAYLHNFPSCLSLVICLHDFSSFLFLAAHFVRSPLDFKLCANKYESMNK